MLTNDEEEILRSFLKEHDKRKHFFEILKRKVIYIPLIILLVYVIDNPKIHILTWLVDYIKILLGDK